jgi:YidC/Oxa1 family membrane protein insertase
VEEKEVQATEKKSDDLVVSMQKQMLYLFPAMTLIFGYTMPSGVILYWFIFSLFSYVQQLAINRSKKGALK